MKNKKLFLKTIIGVILVSILLGAWIIYQVYAATQYTADDCPYNLKFTQIECYGYVSFAVDSNGNLWGWGTTSTLLGSGIDIGSSGPVQISANAKFKDIALGDGYVLALDTSGNIWSWGKNGYGQLGNGGTTNTTTPAKVTSGTVFTKIEASYFHSMAIDSSGNLYTWGSNATGQLGNGSSSSSDVLRPTKIMSGTTFTKIAAGAQHSMAIDSSGKIWTWGYNRNGQLGNGNTTMSATPINVATTTKFKEISSADDLSVAIDTSGNIWTWGVNTYGQLGNGNTTNVYTPTKVTSGTTFTKIEAGHTARGGKSACFAIDSSGKLWSWGYNEYWWLGNGTTTTTYTPQKVFTDLTFTDISPGQLYAIAIDNKGEAWSWGNDMGESTGTGFYAPKNIATRITGADYVITFMNGSTIAKQVTSKLNGTVTAPSLTKTGYTLSWDKSFSKITGDLTVNAVWTESTYTVTFKNGSETAKTQTVSHGAAATAPTLTKAGYTLSWDKAFNNVTSNLTVNAVWTANTNTAYKVQHYKQNTSLNGYDLAETENKTGTTDTTVTASKKTYTGFAENTSYSGRVASGTVAGNGSLVLKLYYDRSNYTVTLNANGGTINAGNVTSYTYGIAKTLPTNVTKTGHTFGGWYANSGLTGSAVTSVTATETGNKTYYAKWNINTYTVTFKNGSETAKTQTVNYGTAATAPTLTKAGYTLSWDKAFNNVTSNLTVNAVWTANTNTAYKVEHYKQNTSLSGYTLAETENKTGTTDTTVTASKKTYEGFTENTSYSGRVFQGNVAGNGSLVLKLYYDRNSYTVTLNANGGTINAGNVTSYKYGIAQTLPTNVTKTGYTFGGWYVNSDLSGNAVTSITATETGNKIYYAKWNINKYTVTFKNGNETSKTETVEHGKAATAPSLTKAGYTLSWDKAFNNVTSNLTVNAVWTANTNTAYKVEYYKQNINLNGYELAETENKTAKTNEQVTATSKVYQGFTENTQHEQRVTTGVVEGNGGLVLKLYYDRNSYNIELNTNGGTINSDKPIEYIYGKETQLPIDVTKEGYIFDGWYDNEGLEGVPVTKIEADDFGDKEYYIKWTKNEFTVIFKNGTATVNTQIVIKGKGATAPELTKVGYTLSWDKAFTNVTSDLTVNAVWTANTNTAYKVEHYLRNLDMEVEGYDLFETENLTGTTDTETTAISKTYKGFTYDSENPNKIVSGNIAGDGSLVLKLYYSRNSYSITYELNEGTASNQLTNSYIYGKGLVLSNRVTKQGHVFAGWYANSELTGESVTTIGKEETGDKTYYAKWIEEEEFYITSEKYSVNMEEKQITKVSPKTNIVELIGNLDTTGNIKIFDLAGEEVSGDTLVGTGYKLQVEFKGTKHEYEIAVRGDLDGNGKISVTDLSILNQIMVKKLTLTGVRAKASDLDFSNKTTITDLSMMNQAIVGKITL